MAVTSMRVALRRSRTLNPVLAVAVIAALALVTAFSAIALAGTKTGLVLGGLAALGPVTLYSSLVAPLLFPFSAFVVLTPFDNLLAMDSFGTLTRVAAVVSGGAVVLYLARTRSYIMPGRALVAWAAFLAWSLATTLWSMDATTAFQTLATLLQLFLLYAAVSFMPLRAKTLRFVIFTTIAGSIIASLYGAYIFHNGQTGIGAVTGRLFVSTDTSKIDPNHFAASMILPMLIALVGGVYSRTWPARIGFFTCVTLIGVGMAISASRGAFLSILIAIVYLLFRSRKRIALAVIAFGGMATALILHGNIIERFQTATTNGGAGRADIWRVGIAAFHDHWLVGAGIGNFPFAFDQAFLRVTQAYYTHWHRASHNIIIQTAVELGVIGLILFGYAWWTQLRALKEIGPEQPLYPLRLALEASLIGLFCAGFFLNIMTEKYLWLALMLITLTRNTAKMERREALR